MDSRSRLPPSAGIWAHHELALAALTESTQALADVPSLVVKGMVLAYALYNDPASRPMADIDLRVRPRDFLRAVRAMHRRGYAPVWSSRQLGAVSFNVRGMAVEIESTIGPPGLCALSVSGMLERSRERVLPGGLRVREPDLLDHAIIMLVNAFKDKMSQCPDWSLDDLESLCDHVDLDVLVTRVKQARIGSLAWIAADWMAQRRAAPVWSELLARLGTRTPRPYYTAIMRRWLARDSATTGLQVLARLANDSIAQRSLAVAATAAGCAVWWIAALTPAQAAP